MPRTQPKAARKVVWDEKPRRWYAFWRRPAWTIGSRGDVTVAAAGIALGLGCALFPWYIFFHQEKFGIRAMEFSGAGKIEVTGLPTTSPLLPRNGPGIPIEEVPQLSLDRLPTGTLSKPSPDKAAGQAKAADQPFPGDGTPFRVVHVENGRAMVEDDTGLWVVERGSTLPDSSQVKKIEKQAGKWVVVTSDDRVIPTSE